MASKDNNQPSNTPEEIKPSGTKTQIVARTTGSDPTFSRPRQPLTPTTTTTTTTTPQAKEDPKNKDKTPEKPEESDPPYSFPSTRGSAFAVYNSLANISFVPGSFGGMSASIAYIRYWSRKGTEQRTEVTTSTETTNSGSQSGTTPSADIAGKVKKNSETPERTQTTLLSSGDNPFGSRPRQPVPVTPVNKARTEDQQTTEAGERTEKPPKPDFFEKLRKLFSANPGAVSKSAPLYQNPFYKLAPDAPDPVGQGVWRFLFNPEELQLSSGPDYNRSETWGVSDPKNEGQALSWRANKNRKLTFSKVLLHGYSFGKRVDSLEKGLQDLFMARDGENGADGPPVLEFVWGNRVFGPCVIQNIQVREKAWDKGILVNAEVSFELEQVPEWTINDGFVDVLRPGRQPLVNDPIAPPAVTQDGNGGNEPPPEGTPPGLTPSGGNRNNQSNQARCNTLNENIERIKAYIKKFELLLTPGGVLSPISLIYYQEGYGKSIALGSINGYINDGYNLYSSWKKLSEYVDSKITKKCGRGKLQKYNGQSELYEEFFNEKNGTIGADARKDPLTYDIKLVEAVKYSLGCAKETLKVMQTVRNSGLPGEGDICYNQRVRENIKTNQDKCKAYIKGTESCSQNRSEITLSGRNGKPNCEKSNGEKVVMICENGKWRQKLS